jgi:hypothetical protein
LSGEADTFRHKGTKWQRHKVTEGEEKE